MTLHLPTLIFADALFLFAIGAMVFLGRPPEPRAERAARACAVGHAAAGLGLLLLLTRGTAPSLLSVALANAAMVGASVASLEATVRLGGRSLPARIRWGVPMATAVVFQMVPDPDDVLARIVLYSAAVIVMQGFTAHRLLLHGAGLRGTRVAAMAFVAQAVLIAARGIASAWAGASTGITASIPGQIPVFLGAVVFSIVSTLAFVTMLNDMARRGLERAARIDPLTGVLNRRGVAEDFAGAGPYAVVAFDLDRFKEINDRHGHAAGDRTLVAFAQRLQAHAGPADAVGRLGGEEFVLLLSGKDALAALALVRRLRTSLLSEPIGPACAPVTFSAGVASSADGGADASVQRMLELADHRMYRAKVTRDAVVHQESVESLA